MYALVSHTLKHMLEAGNHWRHGLGLPPLVTQLESVDSGSNSFMWEDQLLIM